MGADLRLGIVEDDPDFRELIVALAEELGAVPVSFAEARSAIAAIGEGSLDAVLTDYRLPGDLDGEDVVRACLRQRTPIPVAVMSVVSSAAIAVELLRLGADDYLVKPLPMETLLERLRLFVGRARDRRELHDLRGLMDDASQVGQRILGSSPALMQVVRLLPRAAHSGAPVLVLGESGTGKELFARATHDLSRRAERAFVAVDCASIPEAIFENELFGHRRGAFTNAHSDQDGVVQRADGGTLFLDEAGELPLSVQAKLLRFLQTGTFRRLGDPNPSRADVRVIAATNRDLAEEVQKGSFREDLYYRLNVIALRVPPLRDRIEDIPTLAAAFLHRFAERFDSPARALSAEATERLVARPWPGNVRELENAVQRAVAMAETPLLRAHDFDLGPDVLVEERPFDSSAPFHEAKKKLIDDFEKRYAKAALRRNGGNVAAAARSAGLARRSLHRLMERHGLDRSGEPS